MTKAPPFLIGETEHPNAAAWYADFKARVTDQHKAEAFARINGQDVRKLAGGHGIAEAYWIIDDLYTQFRVIIKPEKDHG